MARHEACELFIEQEIEAALKEKKQPADIGRELSEWIGKLFETKIKPRTIEQKVRRLNIKGLVTDVTDTVNAPDNTKTVKSSTTKKDSSHGGKRTGSGRKSNNKFNATNNSIKWAKWSWNPVTGCEHGCKYCYARDIANRFYKEKFEPTFHKDRLDAPINTKIPEMKFEWNTNVVFVCSMADLFGEWMSKCEIESIIRVAEENPNHTFQFLTKNPKRYLKFKFPKNCWLGLTIDKINTDTNSKLNMLNVCGHKNKTFISFEPLLGDMSQIFNKTQSTSLMMKNIDLVIVGAMTGPGAIKPKKEWIDSIKHKNILYKNNIKKYL